MTDEIDKIRIYGDPVLRKPSEKVTEFDGSLAKLEDRLVESMFSYESGIGLSAPQIGESRKILVIDLSFGENTGKILTMVNPEIVETEGECTLEEGCLSVPGIFETVVRPVKIFARYQDIDGNEREIETGDFLARVIQHEADHLEGILFVDRLSTIKRKLLSKKLRTLAKGGVVG